MSAEVRQRPVKQFRVLRAHGPWVKGAIIQPTGLLRSQLLARRVIEELEEIKDPVEVVAEEVPALLQAPAEVQQPALELQSRGRGRKER